ncbi:hypothetical protein KY389_04295 [Paracoccus bogoriensis]|uniref:hypothetical protein n=1 Tax=Paracoccus bogoriensis TaxID=242065 RepID=UPI001CA49377|nr:hypothetical protein [Paracoccus bogoriensis]MBW7055917.1 hypothetical protein [Paracoccus bogoriensis]
MAQIVAFDGLASQGSVPDIVTPSLQMTAFRNRPRAKRTIFLCCWCPVMRQRHDSDGGTSGKALIPSP